MKQRFFKSVICSIALLMALNFSVASALPVLADNSDVLWGGQNGKDYVKNNSGLPAEENVSDPRLVASNIIRYILGFLGILAVIIILYAGFKWMLSGGSEEKVGEAKKMLVAGIIGLVIILCAFAIANFVIEQLYNATSGG
ncbi:MAG: pilin [Patescibacteria group bacterium]|nr:pilin [Patescibacteria group bacterium]